MKDKDIHHKNLEDQFVGHIVNVLEIMSQDFGISNVYFDTIDNKNYIIQDMINYWM